MTESSMLSVVFIWKTISRFRPRATGDAERRGHPPTVVSAADGRPGRSGRSTHDHRCRSRSPPRPAGRHRRYLVRDHRRGGLSPLRARLEGGDPRGQSVVSCQSDPAVVSRPPRRRDHASRRAALVRFPARDSRRCRPVASDTVGDSAPRRDPRPAAGGRQSVPGHSALSTAGPRTIPYPRRVPPTRCGARRTGGRRTAAGGSRPASVADRLPPGRGPDAPLEGLSRGTSSCATARPVRGPSGCRRPPAWCSTACPGPDAGSSRRRTAAAP